MNPILVANASQVVPETTTLVNMVRLRVRQLAIGHRPLVLTPPGMGLSDVALSEIAAGKLESEAVVVVETPDAAAPIITFPAAGAVKKKAA